ncbi:hypothetical protein [Paenibacillus massiliensis]|uniref:hypothetical protein n=1 Tax=Paenibacillus massiliensis TaxID=225917 RepID=UPI00048CBF8B|nr:hypothetical protein [Paenibacillus massiliensis]
MSEKLANYINSIYSGASHSAQKDLKNIEMKDQFRENDAQSWMEIARVLKNLPTHELAMMIEAQTTEVSFTDEELTEIWRALGKNERNIERMITSEKVSEKDREVAKQWKQHNESAQCKIRNHF